MHSNGDVIKSMTSPLPPDSGQNVGGGSAVPLDPRQLPPCFELKIKWNKGKNVPNYVFPFYWMSNTWQNKLMYFLESVPIVFCKLVLKLVTQL